MPKYQFIVEAELQDDSVAAKITSEVIKMVARKGELCRIDAKRVEPLSAMVVASPTDLRIKLEEEHPPFGAGIY